jgi:hypothetical protein
MSASRHPARPEQKRRIPQRADRHLHNGGDQHRPPIDREFLHPTLPEKVVGAPDSSNQPMLTKGRAVFFHTLFTGARHPRTWPESTGRRASPIRRREVRI